MNALKELLDHTKGLPPIKWVFITRENDIRAGGLVTEVVVNGRFDEAARRYLDFEYDNGYGSQELFGTIWYDDGTWSSRGEYDGSEWWEYHKCPELPKEDQVG